MPSTLTALLCLGLYLSRRISTQKQTFSKPIIWAEPNFMIPNGKLVAIWCKGTYRATEYRLHFERQLLASGRPKLPGLMNKVNFSIQPMSSSTAGQYTCFYRIGELWSEPSDPLDLVVTGMYDTPTLSVHPGPEVIPGANVTFYCHLETATNTFFLLREGRSSRPQRRYGSRQAEFPMGPVTTAHRGTYRCFGSYNDHIWSLPSEPVTLLVTGDAEDTSLAPTGQPSSPDSWEPHLLNTKGFQAAPGPAFWDPATENLLRISLAVLTLGALLCLLTQEWLSGTKTPDEGTSRASGPERRVRFRTQRGLDE